MPQVAEQSRDRVEQCASGTKDVRERLSAAHRTIAETKESIFEVMSEAAGLPVLDRFDAVADPANYAPLTPLSLIARTAYTYPRHLAVVHGERRYTWAETYSRSRR